MSVLDSLGLTVLIQTLALLGKDKPIGSDYFSRGLQRFVESTTISDYPWLILALLVGIFAVKGLIQFWVAYFGVHLKFIFTASIRLQLIRQLAGLQFAHFATLDAGKLQNQLTLESQRLIAGFMSFFKMVQQYIMLSVYVLFALIINPFFVVFCGVGISFTNLIYRVFNRKTVALSKNYTEEMHGYQSILLQLVRNFYYLKGTASLDSLEDDLSRRVRNIETEQESIGWYTSLTVSLREPFVITIIAIALAYFVLYLGNGIAAITVVILLMYRAMNFLQAAEASRQKYYGIVGSIDTIIELEADLSSHQEPEVKAEPLGHINEVVFDQVRFSYDGDLDFAYNFKVAKGQTIAIIGKSGSGKTTLLSILLGLYHPQSGQVKINGRDLSSFDLNAYRSRVGLIDQNTVVFNDSIFNNVTSWAEPTPANLEKFWRVLADVNLEDTFRSRKLGHQTVLGDNGMKVSGGQRQRISIARELYKDFDLLIMDEATASLDAISANIVRRSLEAKNSDCIRFIISHKLSSIQEADLVLLLDNGKVVAQGTFEQVTKESELGRQMLREQSVYSPTMDTYNETE